MGLRLSVMGPCDWANCEEGDGCCWACCPVFRLMLILNCGVCKEGIISLNII